MARILDFYDVKWSYEPVTFPIVWNLEGDVIESFSPDFYLPDLDLFLEMTTLKQSLVRKKNRKLRRLRELYPDVRIKLFYARDFRAMLLKYGRFALVESLSGTIGQMGSDRAARVPALAVLKLAPEAPAGAEALELSGEQTIPESPAIQPPAEIAVPISDASAPARLSRTAARRQRRRHHRAAAVAAAPSGQAGIATDDSKNADRATHGDDAR